MSRSYYEATVEQFRQTDETEILGHMAVHHQHALETQQRNAWIGQIRNLKAALSNWQGGTILLEYSIPRMGKRCDVILLSHGYIFVIEYKVGAEDYSAGIDQVLDYALDLKNFHAESHDRPVVPILVATNAPGKAISHQWYADGVAYPLLANEQTLAAALQSFAQLNTQPFAAKSWCESVYRPTPTILEAAKVLYEGHQVEAISRSDADAKNLTLTTGAIAEAISTAKTEQRKTICFITGVPGSGKTLAGLNLATSRKRNHEDEHAVFLSGNGPLVDVLREALVRDEVDRQKSKGQKKYTKKNARAAVTSFIQNIHHFRDDNLATATPPDEKVVIFDEAQRAWNREQASRFMREKRGQSSFDQSEPEFLLSVMDRHSDWCVVVCLIGGGQEINTGEAGLAEWFHALERKFPHWRVLCSNRIDGPEYMMGTDLKPLLHKMGAKVIPDLHLGVCIRSYRAENLASFVAAVIAGNAEVAKQNIQRLGRYPLVLTRDLGQARAWLRNHARGSERYGLVATSGALRLKAEGIHVGSKIQPAEWFLNSKDDVRSAYQLEDVATEFDIQGLELDWVGVCWDGDFRYRDGSWAFHTFHGSRWINCNDRLNRLYMANAYRVLLTRARQGQVIFIPRGSAQDGTRLPSMYDGTFEFLKACGIPVLEE
ncbi:DUF2075 domain-containing protein [Pyxidicoccus fallax]|uniref:DUF2075 domain-containing protein n=1 Tax=Pyxidicoccus fallax TaxID=394095 RepID=A0A848LYJ4_9BACT|nr:DUF2075 domain-containing protein [Pyxidicoccus fallax]NMO22906.1 DUF2075 domain-containing protein [Pyxidicoccus fallax]NPC85727.1 DUF2075 domain-containing protein [Pyxidicoccus fallax]